MNTDTSTHVPLAISPQVVLTFLYSIICSQAYAFLERMSGRKSLNKYTKQPRLFISGENTSPEGIASRGVARVTSDVCYMFAGCHGNTDAR